MELKLLSIKNWREIKNMDLYFENLMLFLGQSSEGVNNIISCLAFIFNSKELEPEDIYDETELAVLKMIFFKNNTRYKLKITASSSKEVRYYIRNSKNWKEISREAYTEFISQIPFFHVSGDMRGQCTDIFKCLFKIGRAHV